METKTKRVLNKNSKAAIRDKEMINKDGRYSCKIIKDNEAILQADIKTAVSYPKLLSNSRGVLFCQIIDNKAGLLERILGWN